MEHAGCLTTEGRPICEGYGPVNYGSLASSLSCITGP